MPVATCSHTVCGVHEDRGVCRSCDAVQQFGAPNRS